MKIRNELVHDFILLIGWNLAPEESHRLLTFTETLVACALSGTFPQEQAKSDTLLRFTIEEGENTISVEEADFRVQKVLNLALSGAPLV
jgi:predicted SPOUT superfamily RNA methylase MTH1